MDPAALLRFLAVGYVLTVAVEAPVLVVGLSPEHTRRRKLAAALWLTACTYPVVVLVLPPLLYPVAPRWAYLAVAETFAPAAEVGLFHLAFGCRRRDAAAIVAANLASFAAGEALRWAEWW